MEDDQQKPKKPLIPFTPVPVRRRNDGSTVEKQYAFIEALAEAGIVEDRRAACPGQVSTLIAGASACREHRRHCEDWEHSPATNPRGAIRPCKSS